MYKIIPEVCSAIIDCLRDEYMTLPKNDEWKIISQNINDLWNFPNCLGCLDGKHFRIKAPPHSGAYFYSYKKIYSIVFMGICDAYKRFIWVNIGDYG